MLKGEEDEHEHGEHEEHGEHGEHEHHHGKYDPHVWLDPVLSQQFAKDIKDELVKKMLNIKMTMKRIIKIS